LQLIKNGDLGQVGEFPRKFITFNRKEISGNIIFAKILTPFSWKLCGCYTKFFRDIS